jgi:hypothetical protein
MLPRFVIACFTIVAVTALMTTAASAGGRGSVPSPGTWNWPPYVGSFGGMPKTSCGYLRVNPYPYNPRTQGRWIYQCR